MIKKLTFSLSCLFLLNTATLAEPVCGKLPAPIMNEKNRYTLVSSSDIVDSIYYDTKTIKIDKKNKTVEVWMLYAVNENGRLDMIKKHGNAFSDYGDSKLLNLFDYSKGRAKLKRYALYACSGDLINSTSLNDNEFLDVIPGSHDEAAINDIIAKYKLK